MRNFTAEVIRESIEKKHELENGEVKVDSEEKKPEETSKINNQEKSAMDINKRELEIAEAVQAWKSQTWKISVLFPIVFSSNQWIQIGLSVVNAFCLQWIVLDSHAFHI